MMRLASLASACHGELTGVDVSLNGVTTDSRADCTDKLFIALRGENFDAHDFVDQAEMRGATALMLEHEVDSNLPSIKVANCHQGLKDIAAWWRAQFVVPVIGITGSVGKTTVKEMTAAIFAELGDGLVTEGNLNNEIGVPLTLLRFDVDDQYAIVEMGMNQAGEIARLTELTRPTIALINNAAAAHLEGLGTVAAVAEAKGEILQGLQADGIAILNADDRHVQLWRGLASNSEIMTFALDADADVKGRCELYQERSVLHVEHLGDEFDINLPVPGKHNVANALAAVAIARAARLPVSKIIAGLEAYQPIGGRLNFKQAGKLTIIDDTYNANPASMAAAIEVLAQHEPSTLIVGDMGELGAVAKSAHREVGAMAHAKGISQLMACGEFAADVVAGFGDKARAFANQDQLTEHLSAQPIMTGAVLVKGSRSAKMERVVTFLVASNESQAPINFAEGIH